MPTLASTSRAQLAYILEVTPGVTPVVGNGTYLRMTGESLDFAVTKEMSKEIRSDRQISSVVPVGAQASGGFNFHLSYGEYDPFLASLLEDAWTVYGTNGVGTTFTADFTTTTITAAVAPTGANALTGLKLGQWFRLLAPSHANNGKLFRVSSSVAPTTTVITLDAGTPATAGSAVASCAVQTSRLTNGVTKTSFTIEKSYTDVTQFFSYKGMTPGKMSLKFASGALTDGSFDFLGFTGPRDVVTALPGSIAASRPYDIHNAATGVGQIWLGTGPLTSTYIKTLTLDYDNVLRGQDAIGTLGLVGVGVGTIALKGSMDVYFADGTIYDSFIANEYIAIIVSSQDASGNGYVFSIPKANISSHKVVAGAKDQDLMATIEFMAVADDTNAVVALRKEIFIDRVGVALA